MSARRCEPAWALVAIAALTLAVLLFAACYEDAVKTERSSNPAVRVELLFEHDGCRVYRFFDSAQAHYFAKCGGGTASVSSPVGCGENCTRDDLVPTVPR